MSSSAPDTAAATPGQVPALRAKRWLVALDVDGTVMREDGVISDAVIAAVQAVAEAGHDIMLSTGRSASMTVPILRRLGIRPRFLVCANGAITLERIDADGADASDDAEVAVDVAGAEPLDGYRRAFVESFDPTEVLQTIRGHLDDAAYGVEDATGHYRVSGTFPDEALDATMDHVDFDELFGVRACRVVVISPDHGLEEFLGIVDRMGLAKVSYNVGWTAWLDIAPEGVTKATAMERVRELLDIPRSRVFAAGDGRNDVDMLRWAGTSGRGVVMGQAPADVIEAGSEVTGTVLDDGLAAALNTLDR
jgi:hydroxymethylpyrimidine pyrophosphatase-like HAD family hydrolase